MLRILKMKIRFFCPNRMVRPNSHSWSNGVKFFYTLPLRTAVNQIFERSTRIFGEEKTGILHSDADVYIWGEEVIRIYESIELARQSIHRQYYLTGDQFFHSSSTTIL